MNTQKLLVFWSVGLLLSNAASPVLAAARVDIVTAKTAPKLERLAAQELADQLKNLFKAEPVVSDTVPAKGENVIVIGSPATNPAVAQAIGKNWPKLSDQGIILKTVTADGKKLLVVGGGSPVATLWAAYELAHRSGARYLLVGDYFPAERRDFEMPSLDVTQEPAWRVRAWRALDDSPLAFQSWGLADQQRVIKQLAKMKFNRIVLALGASQPFVRVQSHGGKDSPLQLFHGERFPIARDSAGRTAFGSATEFTNPDLAGKKSAEELLSAGTTLVRGLIDAAHSLGMSTALEVEPVAFSLEPRKEASIKKEAATRIKACLKTYPAVDALYLDVDLAGVTPITASIKDEHLLERSGQPERELNLISADGRRIIPRPLAGQSASGHDESPLPHSYILPLADASLGVLPQVHTRRLHKMLADLRIANKDRKVKDPTSAGFLASAQMVGDAEPTLYYLSRAGFDAAMTPEKSCQELYSSICGRADPAERMREAFDSIEKANDIIEAQLPKLGLPRPGMLNAAQRGKLSAEAIADALKEYSHADDEIYRAWSSCQANGQRYLYYYAKRGEFSIYYMTCVDALSKAADALYAGKPDASQEQLDAAAEALYTGIECVREIARDQGDRACIAVLNKYAYRPLVSQPAEGDSAKTGK